MLTDPVTDADRLEIRDVVRRFARERFDLDAVRAAAEGDAGYDLASWKLMADLGWVGLAVPEEHGGSGMGTGELCLILGELGAALAPVPFLSTSFAVTALRLVAEAEPAAPLLSGLADGSRICALVIGAGRVAAAVVSASEGAGGWTLRGHARYCLDAGRADPLLVVAELPDGTGSGIFAVDPADCGVTVHGVPSVDATRRFAEVGLDGAAGRPLHRTPLRPADLDGLVDHLAVLLAADLAGQAERCLRITLDYLGARRQFGKPIGSFQALKHRAAELAVGLTTARELVWGAAECADAGDRAGLALAAPLAFARTAELARRVGEEGIQLHGGIGFTDEAPVGLYYKRAISDAELLEHPAGARAHLRDLLGLGVDA